MIDNTKPLYQTEEIHEQYPDKPFIYKITQFDPETERVIDIFRKLKWLALAYYCPKMSSLATDKVKFVLEQLLRRGEAADNKDGRALRNITLAELRQFECQLERRKQMNL